MTTEPTLAAFFQRMKDVRIEEPGAFHRCRQLHAELFPVKLPAADTIMLGREPLEGMLVLDLPPFDGVEDAQLAGRAR